MGTIDCLVPLMLSASAVFAPEPTAVQAVAEVHDTAVRASCGVLCKSLHCDPFQRSTRDLPNTRPTAVQAFCDVHETPVRSLAKLGRISPVEARLHPPTPAVPPLEQG
jgi:hypothetical protein